MFKRSTKITSLLVAAASVASMVPAYAADYKKIDTEEGTVYNAVAYKDGQSYIDGEVNDKDEAAYYVKDGKYTPLDDIDSGDTVQTYGTKYVEEGSKNDGDYYLDLTTGKVSDDEIAQNTLDDASSALKRKVKKDDPSRYADNDQLPATIDETSEMGDAKIPSNKFGDDWYVASYTAADPSDDTNGNATSFAVYTDNEGNYIDADYNLGKVSVMTTAGDSVDVKNTGDDKNDARVAVRGIKTIAQDKDFIYRIAKVVGNNHVASFGTDDITANNKTTSGAEVTAAGYDSDKAQLVIQKISKAQDSDETDGAKYAKTVYTYFVTDDGGSAENLYANFTVSNGKLINYKIDDDANKVYAQAITLKTKNGYNYTDVSDGDDIDLDTSSTNGDIKDSVDFDVDGNLYAVDAGYVYKFNNDDSFDKIYKVDGAFDKLSVYDENNMVVWSSDDDDDVYSVIGGKDKTKDTDTTGTTDTTTTTTTAAAGWVQNTTDGTWTYVNTDGTKKTGWFQDTNATWYYLGADGVMKTGWYQDTTGTWYYSNESGAMLHDTTVGGYTLGSNGAWVQ